jgi:nucleoside-diphosphate-sugar epimerase
VRVAITGVTGFVGWHLAEGFRDAGWDVCGIVRPGNTRPVPDRVVAIEAALERDALTQKLADASLVVHAAGVTHARREADFQSINAGGTEAVVRALGSATARVVYVSSQAAAGAGTVERPACEVDEPRPLTAYGRSKAAAEAIVRSEATVPWSIVRPSSVYGPRDRQFLPLFKMAARGLFPLAARPTLPFTLIHVQDLVRATLLASVDPKAVGETLFVGHQQTVTTETLLKALAEAFDRNYRPLRVPQSIVSALALAGAVSWAFGRRPLLDAARVAELRSDGFVCAVDHAREVLGFTASVELPAGIQQTLQWYRDEGWI